MASQSDAGGETRPRRAPSLRGRVRIARWLLAATIFGSAMAIGSIHAGTIAGVVAALALATWLSWSRADSFAPRSAAGILLFTAVGLTAFTALQTVPLPVGLLSAIAPSNAEVWARALAPLREAGPRLATLSLDPTATRVEVARGVAYLLTFLLAVRIASRPEGVDLLSRTIVITATVLGLAALLHPAFGAEKVFGLYRPETAISPRHIAPLLNPNALAAYVNIGFALALASALNPSATIPGPISTAFAVVLAAMELWIGSRGGVLGLVVAAGLVIWLLRGSRATGRGLRGGTFIYIAVVGVAIVMIVVGSSDTAGSDLSERDISKVRIATEVLGMLKAFPLFGVGRGAFESTFPAFRSTTGYVVFTHPENILLQWPAEWGVIVSGAAFGLIAYALRPSVVLARPRSAVGPWAALCAVGLHNLVDFSSEVPGVVVCLTACAAIVVAGSNASPKPSFLERWGRRPQMVARVGVALAALALVLAVPTIGNDLYSDRAVLHDLAVARVTRDRFINAARPAMLRHPGEPYLPYAGALRAETVRDESPIPWSARALERSPVHGPAHLMLARTFFRRSPGQARLEYRYAIAQAPGLVWVALEECLPLVNDYDDAFELTPAGADGILMAAGLARGLEPRLPATAFQVDLDLERREPNNLELASRRARHAYADLKDAEGAPWCARDRGACGAIAADRSRRLIELRPTACEGYLFQALSLAEMGERDRARAVLSDAANKVDDRAMCLQALVGMGVSDKNERVTTDAIDRLVRAECATTAECVANIVYVCRVEEERGQLNRALTFYRKGYERYPDHDELLAGSAHIASRMGLHAEALDSYRRLALQRPDNATYRESLETERAIFSGAAP